MPVHPLGRKARVLLSSVFGPFAQDDEYGSRAINPMELYHNQVTRAQGPFSLRMFHRSWGLMMIQSNISAPCTLLDFPTLDDFRSELRAHHYDVVGISSIIVNVGKVREMCRVVREESPQSQIVIGGHVAAIPGLEQMIDADHIVRGEGIAWMRAYLGEDPHQPIRHPNIQSGFGTRMMGLSARKSKATTAATVIPSVGCPLGCNFCTTSAFFGGKGKFQNFFDTGDELFAVMETLERDLECQCFFVMDENFLLHKPRAMQLLRRMQESGKSWELYVFSSANALRKYTMEELVALGVSWVWMGLESPRSQYAKLNGTDTLALTRELQANGIRVLGSTIIGLEHHTPGNIGQEIAHAVAHGTDFHQFMLYTPVPGTPLYTQIQQEGRLLDVDLADIHGQYKFNFQHAAISRDASKHYLDEAFQLDYYTNGPSLMRICRTTLEGWRRHRHHPEARIRTRFARESVTLRTVYSAALYAMEKRLWASNRPIAEKARALRKEIAAEPGGWLCTASATLFGPFAAWSARREEKRLIEGFTYEPPTFREQSNWTAAAAEDYCLAAPSSTTSRSSSSTSLDSGANAA
ncbi:MAG: cobalamin-dependent protein [Bryobacterales bacterium]|jgi:hypothetical protein|nr:cobalamin-dependent protein [Bryobacterales bacterium]